MNHKASERFEDLKRMLTTRRSELVTDLQATMRSVRDEGPRPHPALTDVGDGGDDLAFTLMQMKAETLNKIEEALVRLDDGTYGACYECGADIAAPRLRALPFAVRCKSCQDGVELAQQRTRALARRSSSALGFDYID